MTRNVLLAATPRRRVSEVAGGTAADCAAVCCCCPCSVMNLLILTVYKIPRRLCIKAWTQAKNNNKKSKKSKKKKAGLLPGPTGESGKTMVNAVEEEGDEKSDDAEAVFEKEMWDRFYGAGFWRTSSSKRVT